MSQCPSAFAKGGGGGGVMIGKAKILISFAYVIFSISCL